MSDFEVTLRNGKGRLASGNQVSAGSRKAVPPALTGSARLATATVWLLIISSSARGSLPITNPQLPLLTTVSQVRSLSPARAKFAYPVRLRATITYFDPADNSLFLQDATGGVWARPPFPVLTIAAGDLVEVQANTTFTDFAPELTDLHLKQIGRAPLPVPDRVPFEQMASTVEDRRWIEIEGRVR